MNPDERELREALDARSGAPSDEFRGRVRDAFRAGRPKGSVTSAIATFVVVALVVATVGVLTYVRAHRPVAPSGAASPARTQSPPPIYAPTTVTLSAPSHDIVWALVADQRLFRSADHGTTWEERSLPAQFDGRPSMTFINGSEGWLLVAGSPATQCEAQLTELWHTTDGAKTWKDLGARIDKTQCKYGIWFVDSRHGFVAASDSNHTPTVYRTSDAGDHWTFSTVPDNPLFVTAAGGFTLHVNWIKKFGQTLYLQASGSQDDATWHDRDFIYTSNDGGATWRWKQKLASPDTVMVTESRWLEFTSPTVQESVNGGQTFAPYPADFKPLSPVLGGTKVMFADATVGYATGRGSLERTTDGGRNWAIIRTPGVETGVPPPAPSPMAAPVDVALSAPSASTVWALVGRQQLLRSTDQGTTWTLRPLPSTAPFVTSISFISANEGWSMDAGPAGTQCSSGTAAIWHTVDAGATWQLILSVTPPNPASARAIGVEQCKEYVTFIDSKHGYVTAWDDNSAPTIYRTSDGGATWSPAQLPDPPGFVTAAGGDALQAGAVRSVGSALLLVACGAQPDGVHCYVFRSLDLGATWTAVVQVPSATIAFVTETRWLFLVAPGKSQETANAGRQWQPFSSDYRLVAPLERPPMVFATSTVGYAEGAVDTAGDVAVLRTTDGGLHWVGIKPLGAAQPG